MEASNNLTGQIQNLHLNDDELDIIKKPRTQYSSNILRRVIPNFNKKDKLSSISMNGLNVISALRLGTGGSNNNMKQKIFTVNSLPKIQSLDARGIKAAIANSNNNGPDVAPRKGTNTDLIDIAEKDSDSSASSFDEDSDKKNSDSDSDGSSSIDMDNGGDDEGKLYQQILQGQAKAKEMLDAKEKGTHVNDLIDQEMIDLLNVCKRLHCPTLESIQDKFYKMGPKDGNKKVLVLDMDETMLQAKFITSQEEREKDDGDFFFALQSASSGSADVQGEPSDSLQISIKMRPYLDLALDFLAKYYEIVVFTAGTQDYADAALDFLDPDRLIIKHRLYR